jgi:hypothetical protein
MQLQCLFMYLVAEQKNYTFSDDKHSNEIRIKNSAFGRNLLLCVSDGSFERVHSLIIKMYLNSSHLIFTVPLAKLC